MDVAHGGPPGATVPRSTPAAVCPAHSPPAQLRKTKALDTAFIECVEGMPYSCAVPLECE